MNRFLTFGLRLARWYEGIDWHWIPLLGQVFMALAILLPLRGGMIPELAEKLDVNPGVVKAFWVVAFFIGALVLYRYRTSEAYILGSIPLMLYIIIDTGYRITLNNFVPTVIFLIGIANSAKIFFRMQNGRIRHD